jgi:uncharacterized protein YegL
MAIFQKPFSNKPEKSDDAGTGALQWITERHVACVFLLDTSGSMKEKNAIGKLNEGLNTFKSQTLNDTTFDEHTKSCIDVALISFGPDVVLQQDFVPVSSMNPPVLSANGGTPMGKALDMALDLIGQQKARYNNLGTPFYRPWVFCITDGEPTDDCKAVTQRLKQMESQKKVLGYCVGVEDFNRNAMVSIFNSERIFELKNLNFPVLFKFVSSSLVSVRNSDPNAGNSVAVDAPGDLHKITMTF